MSQVALITGAASGLGQQLARMLSAEGATIAGVDVSAEGLEKLAAELQGMKFAWAMADVTDRTAVASAVARLEHEAGPIDLLIASAGIGMETSALNLRAEDIERIIHVNLLGVSNSIAAVLPGMIHRRRGHLVGISSLASYRGLPRMAGYCASKAGLNALLDAFRGELEPLGIAVTTVCPGWVRTPMTAQLDVPMRGLLEVEEAARRILEAIHKRRAFVAFPPSTARQVRLLRWLPARLGDRLIRRMMPKIRPQS